MNNWYKQTFEIVDLEDRCTGFCRSTLKLGTVYLDKSVVIQVGAEHVPDSMLKPENCLIGHCLRACQDGGKRSEL